jgi:hypothetical protein
MIWQYNTHSNLIMVYGFIDEFHTQHYEAVFTLHINPTGGITYGFGFLSITPLSLAKLKSLWYLLKKIIPTQYLQFEVLIDQSHFYKLVLPVVKIQKTTTFNGNQCEVLTIDMKKELSPITN